MLTLPTTLNQAIAAVTGFTTPTYTTTPSSTTVPNGKVYTVTAKGGTQPSAIDVHSASRNFSFLVTKPANVRSLPALNGAGQLPDVPVNVYTLSTRKGVTVLAGQPAAHAYIKSTFGIPAGADSADPDNLAALVVAHCMALAQMPNDIRLTTLSGEI